MYMFPETQSRYDAGCILKRYGFSDGSDWKVHDVRINRPFTEFSVSVSGKHYHTFRTVLMGHHNIYNALSRIAVMDSLGIPPEISAKGLETFPGVKRRQEIRE